LINNHKDLKLDGGKNNKDKDGEFIFRPWITTKNGKRIYAKEYGLKAFKIYIS